MTISEASQQVLQAGALCEESDAFVLNMGQPVRIVDLARQMIRLSGLTVRDQDNPNGDIEIRFIGLRPGEKMPVRDLRRSCSPSFEVVLAYRLPMSV